MVAEAVTEADRVGADTAVADALGVEATGAVDVLAEAAATEVKFDLYIYVRYIYFHMITRDFKFQTVAFLTFRGTSLGEK